MSPHAVAPMASNDRPRHERREDGRWRPDAPMSAPGGEFRPAQTSLLDAPRQAGSNALTASSRARVGRGRRGEVRRSEEQAWRREREDKWEGARQTGTGRPPFQGAVVFLKQFGKLPRFNEAQSGNGWGTFTWQRTYSAAGRKVSSRCLIAKTEIKGL